MSCRGTSYPGDAVLQAGAGQVADALSRLECVEWLPAGQGSNQDIESAIVTACVKGQASQRQVVFTQSADMAQRVEGNSSSPAHRGAIRVHARCVLVSRHMSWSNYAGLGKGGPKLSSTDVARFSRFLIDTCSFMLVPHEQRGVTDETRLNFSGLRFLDQLLPVARANGARIVVPQEVRDELGAQAGARPANSNASVVAPVAALKALAWLDRPDVRALTDVLPRMLATGHADPAILAWLTEVGPTRDVCVITQDGHLLADLIDNLPRPPRFSRVCRISDWGDLLFDTLREHHVKARKESGQRPVGRTLEVPDGIVPGELSGPATAGANIPAGGSPQRSSPAVEAPQSLASGDHSATAPNGRPHVEMTSTSATPPPGGAAAGVAPPPDAAPLGSSPDDRSELGKSAAVPAPGAETARHSSAASPVLPESARVSARRPWLMAAMVAVAGASALALAWPTRELSLALVVEGRPVSMTGNTASLLPGTRFTVQAISPSAGSVELHAFNASDPESPVVLMRVRVMPGETVSSPVLRVEPGPGTDRLDLIHLPDNASKVTRTVYVRQR